MSDLRIGVDLGGTKVEVAALDLSGRVLDPDVVVLGGGLSKLDQIYRRVPELIGRYLFSDRVALNMRPPAHVDSSGVRGAAWLWQD